MSESFAELFEQSQIEGKMRPGTIVSATVVDVNQDTVVVNAGLKSEGLIPIEQFFDDKGDNSKCIICQQTSVSSPIFARGY